MNEEDNNTIKWMREYALTRSGLNWAKFVSSNYEYFKRITNFVEKRIRQETLKEVKEKLYEKLKSNGSKNALNCVDEVIEELSKK